ncbi:innexin unc-7-like [Liolophura sinensis]|uniref:innexin unc-7-like n=1 Tax=Liolophura sinensis TaxID=3198878 RepID=UPI003158B8A5
MMTTGRVYVIFAIFLAIMAVMTGYLQYFGSPALCWCPNHFTGAMVFYVNSVCFLTDSYYIPGDPFPGPLPIQSMTNHFKWTPFALLFLASLYVIPEISVTIGSSLFGSKVDTILKLCKQSIRGDKETRDVAIQQLIIELDSRFVKNANRSKFWRCISSIIPSLPVYARLQEVGGKLMYVLGSLIPLIFLCKIFPENFDMNHNIVSEKNETYFPKLIFCEVEIRQLQNIQRYTLQCHLPANDMFERISLLVGFLALVISSISSGDVICCLVARLFGPRHPMNVERHLKVIPECDTELFSEFTEHYLRADGIYLFQLIGQNSTEAVVSQILSRLWEDFKTKSLQDKPPLPPLYAPDDKDVLVHYEHC